MGNPARGKGHEGGGLTKHKGGIKPQETPCSRASIPKNQSLPDLLCYAFHLLFCH